MNIQAAGSSALYALSQPAPFRSTEGQGEDAAAFNLPQGKVQDQTQTASTSSTTNPSASPTQNPTARPPSPAEQARQEAEAKKTADKLQKVVGSLGHDLKFSVDKESGAVVIKIVDPQSQEVIRQIPSEEAMRIAKAIDTLRGVLIDQSA